MANTMYESITRQSLPTKEYRELLGTALCVFSSNNGFFIENILRFDANDTLSWYELIDKSSGELPMIAKSILANEQGQAIVKLFQKIVKMRNRIIHSLRITNKEGEQSLATKTKDGIQFEITEAYLMEFIQENNTLSSMLHELRGW